MYRVAHLWHPAKVRFINVLNNNNNNNDNNNKNPTVWLTVRTGHNAEEKMLQQRFAYEMWLVRQLLTDGASESTNQNWSISNWQSFCTTSNFSKNKYQAHNLNKEDAMDCSRWKKLIKMIRMVGGWMFLLVPAHPGSPRQRAAKRLLLLLLKLESVGLIT